jgi:hypothetical protein
MFFVPSAENAGSRQAGTTAIFAEASSQVQPRSFMHGVMSPLPSNAVTTAD